MCSSSRCIALGATVTMFRCCSRMERLDRDSMIVPFSSTWLPTPWVRSVSSFCLKSSTGASPGDHTWYFAYLQFLFLRHINKRYRIVFCWMTTTAYGSFFR
ncbi:unnamed protein product [Onchocerca flexuosa]|uniref:Secreted protein n=1 Tax=Onchocerca flexuosa TaxID=387005 RepID=A0A183HXL7_9BILA|nr:unnamed protein product [Onchocerca flexuosa]